MELLAPCGSPDHLEEAIRSGADACYFGAQQFSARAHAGNFSRPEIRQGVAYAHDHGVAMHGAVNTLIYNDEIDQLVDLAAFLGEVGVDAFIVQDLGVAKILREGLSHIPLHASTQTMTRHPQGLAVLKAMGFERAVLARETSLQDLPAFMDQGLDIEAFAHGAQCVSYSGACYFSAFHGGRSANRGDCAQACRKPYELYAGGQPVAKGHLLSPKDMDALDLIPDLLRLGVDSLKIEGRMKSVAYVAVTCRAYRLAIDAAMDGHPLSERDRTLLKKDMAQVFSRGGEFSTGYFLGPLGKDHVYPLSPKNTGIQAGRVLETSPQGFRLQVTDSITNGDGYALYDQVGKLLASGYLQGMTDAAGQLVSEAQAGERVWINTKTSAVGGQRFFRNHAKNLAKELKKPPQKNSKETLDFYLEAQIGRPLVLTLLDQDYRSVTVESDYVVEKAQKQATSPDLMKAQLARLGDSAYAMGNFYPSIAEGAFVPSSVLNDLRRQGIEAYQRQYEPTVKKITSATCDPQETRQRIYTLLDRIPPAVTYPKETLISVEVSRLDQALAAMEVGCHQVMVNLTPYRQQALLRDTDLAHLCDRAAALSIGLGITWSPMRDMVSHPAYLFALDRAKKAGIDLLGVKNLSFLPEAKARHFRLQAEPNLNITNDIAISQLVDLGFESVILSTEMTPEEMGALSYKGNISLGGVLFGDVPLMFSAYCPPGATIGGKEPGAACAAPCLTSSFALQSPSGGTYPIMHDGFCRVEIYDDRLLDGMPYLSRFHEANLDQWRLSFVRQSPERIASALDRLWTYLEGGPLKPMDTARMDGFMAQGVTRNHG